MDSVPRKSCFGRKSKSYRPKNFFWDFLLLLGALMSGKKTIVTQIILLGQRVKEKVFGSIRFGFSTQNLFLVRYTLILGLVVYGIALSEVHANCKSTPVLIEKVYYECRVERDQKVIKFSPLVIQTPGECSSYCASLLSEKPLSFKQSEALKKAVSSLSSCGALTGSSFPQGSQRCDPHETKVASQVGSSASEEGFNQLLEALSVSDEQLCHQDKDQIRLKSLRLMDSAYFSFIKQRPMSVKLSDREKRFSEQERFQLIMIKKWEQLANEVQKRGSKVSLEDLSLDRHFEREGLKSGGVGYFVKRALERGIVPLPTFKEETKDGKSLFSFGPLGRYLFLGLAPVTITDKTEKELAERDEHPLNPSFINGAPAMMLHDIQHASNVMAPLYSLLQLGNPKRCGEFQKCIRKLSGLEKGSIRKALFYLLHEDPSPLLVDSTFNKNGAVDRLLLDFALESVLHKEVKLSNGERVRQFELGSLLGKSEEEKRRICGSLESAVSPLQDLITHYALMDRHQELFSEASMKRWEIRAREIDKEIVTKTSFIDGLFSPVLKQTLQEKTRFNLSGDNFSKFTAKLLLKLQIKCNHEVAVDRLIMKDPEKHLEKNFERMIKAGFPEALEKEVNSMMGAFEEIGEVSKKIPACKEFFVFGG